MTEGLACPECGFVAGAPQGLGAHRRYRHGIEGALNDKDKVAEYQRAYREANKDKIAEKKRAYILDLIDRVDEADWVEVENAADAAMSGTAIRVAEPVDRVAAAVDVMRRGGRSTQLGLLGWGGTSIRALLDWWDGKAVAA